MDKENSNLYYSRYWVFICLPWFLWSSCLSDLQTALDARDIPGTSSAFINYIIGISSILSATKKYFLSCIAHTQGGIFEFLLSSLACVATFYYYIVAIRVLFIPVSEIRRIFISKCIPSFDIPKIKPITIFI